MKQDQPINAGKPKGFQGTQMDGTPIQSYAKPTKARLQDRPAVPDRGSDSGIERALGVLADFEHRAKK